MKLKTILKIIAILLIFFNIWLSVYLWYSIYQKQSSIKEKESSFFTANRTQFNNALYSKAFTVDNKLIKYLSKKILLINFKDWEKYIKIDKIKIDKSYLLKKIKLYMNYNNEKDKAINWCYNWFYNKKVDSKQKNKKLTPKNSNYTSCINFLSNYNQKNSNIYIPLVSSFDLWMLNNYNSLDKKSIWSLEDIYTKYCNNQIIGIMNIDKSKNNKLKPLLCKNMLNQTKRFNYAKVNIFNIKYIRKIELFFKIFWEDYMQKLRINWLKSKYINNILNILKKNNSKKDQQIIKRIKMKDLFVNCYNIFGSLNLLNSNNLIGDKENIKIIKNYVRTNKHEVICISTNFNKKTLSFSKKIFTILTDWNININSVSLSNFIYQKLSSFQLFKNIH